MSIWVARLRRLHHFCVEHLVYPLVLSTLLACAIYAGRVYFSHRWTFNFLLWNLFLAWIPYACSLAMTLVHLRLRRYGWLLLLPGLVWLIFFPNAPYIVTDLWHLDDRPPMPVWYDIGMLATFAWTGCFLAIVSLNQMQHIVRRIAGAFISWLFVLSTIGLSGLGIYLGRFLKWNSWDLLLRPQSVLAQVGTQLVHPLSFPRPFGVTLMFAAFLLVCYLTFISIEQRQPAFHKTD